MTTVGCVLVVVVNVSILFFILVMKTMSGRRRTMWRKLSVCSAAAAVECVGGNEGGRRRSSLTKLAGVSMSTADGSGGP